MDGFGFGPFEGVRVFRTVQELRHFERGGIPGGQMRVKPENCRALYRDIRRHQARIADERGKRGLHDPVVHRRGAIRAGYRRRVSQLVHGHHIRDEC